MFKVDSRIAGDILGITPEAYRRRLSRVRAKMADFLKEYCEVVYLERTPEISTTKIKKDLKI